MWLTYLAYFLGGGLLANAIPHFVNGVSGRAFQSPFAKPPGVGLSSPTVNVIWGTINAVVGYLLLCRVGAFDIGNTTDAAALGFGMFATSLFLARYFGKLHSGNAPQSG